MELYQLRFIETKFVDVSERKTHLSQRLSESRKRGGITVTFCLLACIVVFVYLSDMYIRLLNLIFHFSFLERLASKRLCDNDVVILALLLREDTAVKTIK